MNKQMLVLLRQTTEKGFTLVEVLVGILLILTFVGVSTQAFVLSTVFKVRGQELSEATTWMQEDLENIRFEASRLAEDPVRCQSTDAANGYADSLRDEIFARAGVSSPPVDANENSPRDVEKRSAIGDRPYTLRRVITPQSEAPYNVMEVRYAVYAAGEVPGDVVDTEGPDAIATSYSEIIPNASFTCR
jgi:prepilin-type N-terminal cleavage/methylation domain-containing protein